MSKLKLLFLPPEKNLTHQVFPDQFRSEMKELTDPYFNPSSEQITQEELAEMIGDFDIAIIAWQSPIFTEKVMQNAHKLKIILHSAGTVKPYVSPAVFEKNVIVTNANDAMAKVTAECALSMMLAGNWEIYRWTNRMKNGAWKERDEIVPGVQGRTVGIIGYGAITRALIPMLKALHDVTILIQSNHLAENEAEQLGICKVSLDELIKRSDIISLQTSLTNKTFHLLNKEKIELIKDNALLINIGRGDLIDEEALYQHLKVGRFRAALDVYSTDPLLEENPLRQLDNVIKLPHLGAATYYCRMQLGREVMDNLKDFLNHQTPRSSLSKSEVFLMSEH